MIQDRCILYRRPHAFTRKKPACMWHARFTDLPMSWYPIPSMGLVYLPLFTYIWLIFTVNVGKYTTHGWYGYGVQEHYCEVSPVLERGKTWVQLFRCRNHFSGLVTLYDDQETLRGYGLLYRHLSWSVKGNARTQPENSSRITCTTFSLPDFVFWTTIKSVASLSPTCLTVGSSPRSLKGSCGFEVTFFRYVLLLEHTSHAVNN